MLFCAGARTAILPSITNVGQVENISYFGNDAEPEADLIYNLPLSSLCLYSLYSSQITQLRLWQQQLPPAPSNRVYFNLTATHDGIGIHWLKGLLTESETTWFIAEAQRHGCYLSRRTATTEELLQGIAPAPWELNATYFDACRPEFPHAPTHVARFLVTQSVVLALQGVPGFYFPLLLAATNNYAGIATVMYLRIGVLCVCVCGGGGGGSV